MPIRKIIPLFLMALSAWGQPNFDLLLEADSIPGLAGLQSYAHATYEGKWIFVGGRLDGLHRRQPWASFDAAGHNNQIFRVDPVSKKVDYLTISNFSSSLYDQLRSTNPQYFQVDSLLYLVGGYGINSSNGNHQTHPFLSIINLAELERRFNSNQNLEPAFEQIQDNRFAVTGGSLNVLHGKFYLVGGHRFDGRYNPHNGPSFTQSYTEEVRRFSLQSGTAGTTVNWYSPYQSAALLHRRDYNVIPQVFANGQAGLIAFSGVFQTSADLPFLNAVAIDSSSFQEITGFSQYYNHYHCANLSLYDSAFNQMHNLFFGGMAQYYDSAGVLVRDDEVPFVNTIASVSRDGLGNYAEYKFQTTMPTLLGSGSEFLINEQLELRNEEVVLMDELPAADTVFLGHIFGGIESSAPNIFFTNDGTQSIATARLFKVYLIRNQNAASVELNPHSLHSLDFNLSPNPAFSQVNIKIDLAKRQKLQLEVTNEAGTKIYQNNLVLDAGTQEINLNISNWPKGTYHVEIRQGGLRKVKSLVVQ